MRSRFSRTLIMLFAVALISAACGGETTDTTTESEAAATTTPAEEGSLWAEVLERGTLVVAVNLASQPGGFFDDEGNVTGWNPEIAEEIAARLGLDGVEYVEPGFEVIVAGNWQGRWDVAIHGITFTAERQEILLYTRPYQFADSVAAIHEDNTDIQDSTTDLDGKAIGVCAGCTHHRYLEMDLVLPETDLEFVVDDAEVRTYEGPDAAFQDLTLGDGVRVDAVIDEISGVCRQIEDGAPIKRVPDLFVFFSNIDGIIFDANPDVNAQSFRDEVDRIMGEMMEEGFFTELSIKWYGWDRTQPGDAPPDCG
jgi:polar amino acid transport system substrate-binding protein